MMRLHFNLGIVLAFALVMGASLAAVFKFERTLQNGTQVLLQLAPVDPRSLMQGDYMALSFAIDRELPKPLTLGYVPRYAYLSLDSEGRASFHSTGNTLPAPDGLIALYIRQRKSRLTIAPNGFFFQEGKGKVYEPAQWGELRVPADGKALLTALRDEDLRVLGEQRR